MAKSKKKVTKKTAAKKATKKSTSSRSKAKKYALTKADKLSLYRRMAQCRALQQRAYDLFMQNLVKGTTHLGQGQEAIAAAFGQAMKDDDYTFCTYRGHNHNHMRGISMTSILGELMGRDIGLLRGKGGSMHLTDVEKGAMGSYAIIGAHMPIAAGAAWLVDGNDAEAMYQTAMTAIEKARKGGGPSLIEALTYRHHGHSRADPATYRPQEEVDEWMKKDPLPAYRKKLAALSSIKEAELSSIDTEVEKMIDEATEAAKNSPPPPDEIAFTDVWADGGAQWRN